jgi:hypothetical protein
MCTRNIFLEGEGVVAVGVAVVEAAAVVVAVVNAVHRADNLTTFLCRLSRNLGA